MWLISKLFNWWCYNPSLCLSLPEWSAYKNQPTNGSLIVTHFKQGKEKYFNIGKEKLHHI